MAGKSQCVMFAVALLALVPSLSAAEDVYARRRATLAGQLNGGTAVVFAAEGSRSVAFRQNPDFYYLTGLDEPGAVLVISPSHPVRKEMLYLPVRDPDDEIWSGERPAISDALRKELGFEHIFRASGLSSGLGALLRYNRDFHVLSAPAGPESSKPKDLEIYQKISGNNPGVSIKNSSAVMDSMRAVKDDVELAKMRKAIEITFDGLRAAIAAAQPGATEKGVAAALDAAFRKHGVQRHAFDPIVGCGEHSTTLHYPIPSDRVLQSGDLLVLDVGAEFEGYAADISRTIPIGGVFSPEQKKVYETVLAAQAAGIAAARPGVSLRGNVHEAALKVIEGAGWGDAFLHGVGHFVGLQVHDRGDAFGPLAPGMVITVEPGIYLKDRALGVRIEDEVLIVDRGRVVLSEMIPKSVEAIEAWASGRSVP